MSRGHYEQRRAQARGYATRDTRAIVVGGEATPAPVGGHRLPAILRDKWFHSIKDRQAALERMGTAWSALAADLATWQTANASETGASSAAQWLAADVTPTIDEWQRFRTRQSGSWWTIAATSWSTYEDWHARLRRMRELARAHGIVLESSEPEELPRTIWETSSEGQGDRVQTYVGIGKIAVVTAVGVMGLWGLYAAVRDMTADT